VVTGSETAENGTITLDGNLIVSATGSLTLTNVTLAMDCSNDGEFGITVEPGGALSVAGSVITSATGKGFDFAVHGASFEMIDSELHGAGWGPEQGLGNSPSAASGERGLVIGTDNALLAGNTISRNHVGVILTDNAILSNTVHGGDGCCRIRGPAAPSECTAHLAITWSATRFAPQFTGASSRRLSRRGVLRQ
jgi:hypothetical protein